MRSHLPIGLNKSHRLAASQLSTIWTRFSGMKSLVGSEVDDEAGFPFLQMVGITIPMFVNVVILVPVLRTTGSFFSAKAAGCTVRQHGPITSIFFHPAFSVNLIIVVYHPMGNLWLM